MPEYAVAATAPPKATGPIAFPNAIFNKKSGLPPDISIARPTDINNPIMINIVIDPKAAPSIPAPKASNRWNILIPPMGTINDVDIEWTSSFILEMYSYY
jgi:hypothetical protein